MTNRTNIKHFWILAPALGTVIFALLYFIATLYYPGGSQVSKNAIGFSWVNNFWCNLLNDKAINGQTNAAQPIALNALFILCLSLTFFWWQFPKYANFARHYKLIIQVCGTLSMIVGFFLFTNFDHDLITNLASMFGLIATAGTCIGLYKNKWKTLFIFGISNIILVIANCILYYNTDLILYLPVVQKITFAAFLIWICLINFRIYQLTKENQSRL